MRGEAIASPAFAAVRGLIRLLLWLFYRRVDVVGAEHLPTTGGLIVAANHHNSIVDAMVLLAVAARPLRTLAKAQLFQHPLIGPFLRLVGALPVNRRQEAGDDPRKNDALFEATTHTLRHGGGIVIFPEGRTQPEPVLLELRTGTARMLLAAQPADVALVPAGLVFYRPGIFREGEALVVFGSPVPVSEYCDLARTDPIEAARQLTAALGAAIRKLIVEAESLETLGLLEDAERVWSATESERPSLEDRVRWLRQAAQQYRALLADDPKRLADYVGRLRAFMDELESTGVSPRGLRASRSARPATRFALRQAFALLLGAPLALCGLLLHGLPYALVGLLLHLLPHTGEEKATVKIVGGVVLYPIAWTIEALLAWRFGGAIALIIFAIVLLPSGFVALSWRERLARIDREIRGFARRVRDPNLLMRLRRRHADLARELKELAATSAEKAS